MPHPRMSIADWNLKDFESTCKLNPKKELSTSFILQKGPLSNNSVSDVNLDYLGQFRKKIGYHEKEAEKTELPASTDEIEDQDEEEKFAFDEEQEEEGEDVVEVCEESCSFISYRLTAAQMEDQRLLEEFGNLKVIDISDNQLKSLRNLGAMPYLQIINASKNLLETVLEIAPPVPASIKEVDFSYNVISSIVELKDYWSLTHINLSHNELTSVEGFSGLNFLQDLDLSYNKIETLSIIDCPNLFYLNLSSNLLESIKDYIGCHNLNYLNLQQNKLSDITGLKYLTQLTELDIAENNIDDITQFEHLKSLLNLSRLKIHPNPITSMQNFRLVMVHTLPQILWLDESYIEPSELREATNMLNPSIQKLAYLDYTTILLDRACRSSNSIFDSFCRNRPLPPILLIVGPPRSHCHTIALLLKDKFRNKVHLGGVHSTATTIEGCHPKLDIPVSYESFQEMKNTGEFLSTCKILGRICGFASSQIARAAEKSALLVASVPLKTALALRHWNLNPKLVLVLPSTLPEFPQDYDRDQAIRRSIQSENSEGLFPKRKSGSGGGVELVVEGESNATDVPNEEHIVNFEDTLSIVPSTVGENDPEKLLYGDEIEDEEHDETSNHGAADEEEEDDDKSHQHSILRPAHFEVGAKIEGDDELENNNEMDDHVRKISDMDDENFGIPRESHVHLASKLSEENLHIMDLEQKQKRLKSIGPGMERYSLKDQDDMDDDDDVDEQIITVPEKELGIEDKVASEVDDNNKAKSKKTIVDELNANVVQPSPITTVDNQVQKTSIPILEDLPVDPTISIFQPNELYSNFQSPGFIHTVMDKTDLCDNNLPVDSIILDALMKGQEESVDVELPPELPPIIEETKGKCGKKVVLKRKSGSDEDEGEEEQDEQQQDEEGGDDNEQEAKVDDEEQEPVEQQLQEEIQEQDDEQEENGRSSKTMDEQQQNLDEMEEIEEINPEDKIIMLSGGDDDDEEQGEQGDEEEEEMDDDVVQILNTAEEDNTKRESTKKRSSLKIKEPVHLDEDLTNEECVEVPREITHKEAMTFSILQTKELYAKFHADNPGVFHAVIDTADLCESYRVVENIVLDALIKFKQELEEVVGTDGFSQQVEKSYVGTNQVDSKYFLGDRLQKMKECCASWNKGRECGGSENGPSQVPTFQLNSKSRRMMEQSEALLTQPTCPRNLLDPTIHRPPITLKMRKLVELTEKRAKCANFQKTSNCDLSYECM